MKRYWMMYVYLLFALSACGTQPSASESGATAEDTTAQEENTGSHEETETEQNEEIESNTESEEASQAGNSPESQENNQQLTEDEDKRQQVFQDGTYERISHTSGGLLDIQDSGDHAFSFEINVSEGANVGHLSGNAKMNEDFQATYQGPDSCSLTFEWKDSNILVSSSDDCKYYSGNGVTFDGVFYGEGHAAEIEPDTLSSLGLLTDEQEDLFKAMVGDDYELFLSTFHLIQEEEIIDSFEGEAYSAKVQGLPGMMEGILMHGHGDALWAAIIDEEKVKYYSNNEIMVPETIEEWAKEFTEFSHVLMPEELPFEQRGTLPTSEEEQAAEVPTEEASEEEVPAEQEPAASWEGEWLVDGSSDIGGSLTIYNEDDTGFSFDLHVSNTHAGSVEGYAVKDGSAALQSADEIGCQMSFVKEGNSITTTEGSECWQWSGAGIHLNHTFVK
ncbi:hypothetical protein [Thalassobacillus sp. C254]|uniref:hypothetical protein n=1 Tax=Thalassobacillus sp. C254 TaxID=1225341 RepID=UPI0006D1E341|nr:hypothetical protein [Thalassobacillus sp. C254]